MMVTSLTVLVLTCSAFFIYEFVSFRQTNIRELTTLGQIIANNTTAPLAFDDAEAANEILASLKAEPHIIVACVYDQEGNIFAYYPPEFSRQLLPKKPEAEGYNFKSSNLEGFQSIANGNNKLGTLYLRSNMGALYERLQLYGIIALTIIIISLVTSYFLSRFLQKRISRPIIQLADTAKYVSDKQDYSIRATKSDEDEIGSLTDSFNVMLNRIQTQTQALVESNSRIQSVINSSLSAVIIMNQAGVVTDWNERAVKIFGWQQDEIIGKDLSVMIVPERYRSAHQQGLANFFITREGPVLNKVVELSALRKGGNEFPVELLICTLTTDNIISFCGFVTDISERKQAEQEAKSFNQRLERLVEERTVELKSANSELESFSYSISHDLRAPLRSIHGYMNILAEEYGNQLDEEANRLINIILQNGQKMGQLIDDLLAFSRLGRSELNKSRISMDEMVSSILEEQKKYEKGREMEINISPMPFAHADHTTIRQVWVNLISNALKYSRQRSKTIIQIGSMEKNSETVYFVKDNGAGFNMKYYDKLFGVFQRLHSHTEFEGTGVGLAIVQRIVSRHGGKVWAEAKVDEGATFYFTLE